MSKKYVWPYKNMLKQWKNLGGALCIMFENHVRSWPLLKTPYIREVICLDTFVYMCIPF